MYELLTVDTILHKVGNIEPIDCLAYIKDTGYAS